MNKQTADNVLVYHLDGKKLVNKVAKMYPSTLGASKSIATSTCEGLVMVPGGYINVDTDCCYSYSITELRARGNNVNVVERIRIEFAVKERKLGEDGKMWTNTKERFSMMFDCADLIANYSHRKTKTLREFMGSRFNYNPRISKNTFEFLKEIQLLIDSSPMGV